MKHVGSVALMSLFTFIGCHGSTLTEPAAKDASASPQAWVMSDGYDLIGQPTRDGDGWKFNFPGPGKSINSVVSVVKGGASGSILAVFSIEASSDAEISAEVGGDGPDAYICLYIERQGDHMGLDQDLYRWWSGASRLRIDRSTGTATISAPLSWTAWTAVHGQQDKSAFEDAIAHMGAVGFTFGGRYAYGHGVNVPVGSATFHLLRFDIQ